MKNFLTTGLLAGLFLAVTLTSAHANEPEQSAQRCDARRVTYLIGEYLSRSVRDEAFRESRATSIKVNSRDLDPDNNRLHIRTDINLDLIAIYCG